MIGNLLYTCTSEGEEHKLLHEFTCPIDTSILVKLLSVQCPVFHCQFLSVSLRRIEMGGHLLSNLPNASMNNNNKNKIK